MSAAHPLDWIEEIEASLLALEEKPQFGTPTPFDWKKAEEELGKVLGREDLKLSTLVRGWRTSPKLFAGIGDRIAPLSIELSPLDTTLFLIFNEKDVWNLMEVLFGSEEAAQYFFDSDYAEAFYHYLGAEALRVVEKQGFLSPLTPRLGEKGKEIVKIIGEQPCFVVDVSIQTGSHAIWGRILLPESFRRAWKQYFGHLGPLPLSEAVKEKLRVEIACEIAHTRLGFEEWRGVRPGDFIALDHCSYDVGMKTGGVVLTLEQKPIFRGRFKDGGIKITQYPIYEEVSDAMDDDEELYDDLEEDEEDFEEEDPIFAGLTPRKPPPGKSVSERSGSDEEEYPRVTPEQLPIHLTVEVARLKMNAQELMNLSPGNLLDLQVAPEQGVDLVVNGKKVGRGELIKMGDVLGVRILSL